MRIIRFVLSFALLCVLDGCATSTRVLAWKEAAPAESETITYDWDEYRIEVSFHRGPASKFWFMFVRDSWDVAEQSLRDGMTWGSSEAKCSAEDSISIIDRSLSRFRRLRPEAKLDSVNLEMQVVDEVWREICICLRTTMRKFDSKQDFVCVEGPPELGREVRRALTTSRTISRIKQVIQKHGFEVSYVGTSGQILFKDSIRNLQWSEVAELPDLGIRLPGIAEIGVDAEGQDD